MKMAKNLWTVLGAATAVAAVPLTFALADGEAAPATCVKALPARQAWVEREVTRPAVMGERCVPVIETVKVPIVETRAVPEFREIDEPVHATREVQDFREEQVPVHGPVQVPLFEARKEPVTLKLPNPFGCDDICLDLWDRCERVPAGTRTETGVIGHRVERVPFTRTETFVSGTQKRRVQIGERLETVTVGEREEQRQTGWRNETFVVTPASVEKVRECVDLPPETVTVVTAGDVSAAQPLPGTTRVVTEAQYRTELNPAP